MTEPCPECGALPAGIGGSLGTHSPKCTDTESIRQAIDRLEQRVERIAWLLDIAAAIDPPTDRHEDEDDDEPGAGSGS